LLLFILAKGMAVNKKRQSPNVSDAADADEIILIDDDDDDDDDDDVETCAADKCLKFVGKVLQLPLNELRDYKLQ